MTGTLTMHTYTNELRDNMKLIVLWCYEFSRRDLGNTFPDMFKIELRFEAPSDYEKKIPRVFK